MKSILWSLFGIKKLRSSIYLKEEKMVKMYYEKDVDKKILKNKKIVLIGYGSQGHAHANNLKESGMDVIVGEVRGANWDKAVKAGFTVLTASEAAKKAEVIMMLVPDEYMADI